MALIYTRQLLMIPRPDVKTLSECITCKAYCLPVESGKCVVCDTPPKPKQKTVKRKQIQNKRKRKNGKSKRH